jgi:hypothetical protein
VDKGPNPTAIHQSFMKSPQPRANIPDTDMDSAGIGIAERNGQLFAVEVLQGEINVSLSVSDRSEKSCLCSTAFWRRASPASHQLFPFSSADIRPASRSEHEFPPTARQL